MHKLHCSYILVANRELIHHTAAAIINQLSCPSSTTVRLDDLRLTLWSPSVCPPMTMMALLWTAATPTAHLGDDNDPIFFYEWSELSYILISAVNLLSLPFHPPTITGGDELGTKAVNE